MSVRAGQRRSTGRPTRRLTFASAWKEKSRSRSRFRRTPTAGRERPHVWSPAAIRWSNWSENASQLTGGGSDRALERQGERRRVPVIDGEAPSAPSPARTATIRRSASLGVCGEPAPYSPTRLGRARLTDDVLAAASGLLDGGASEVMGHTQERGGYQACAGPRRACGLRVGGHGETARALVAPTLEPLPGTMLRLGLRFGGSAGFQGGRAARRAVRGQGGEQR